MTWVFVFMNEVLFIEKEIQVFRGFSEEERFHAILELMGDYVADLRQTNKVTKVIEVLNASKGNVEILQDI